MAADVFDDEIENGVTYNLNITYTGADVSAYTPRMHVRKNVNSGDILIDVQNVGTISSIFDGTNTVISVSIPATQTALLPIGVNVVYDVILEQGADVMRIVYGKFYVKGIVTHD